jgi:hypothetical protein
MTIAVNSSRMAGDIEESSVGCSRSLSVPSRSHSVVATPTSQLTEEHRSCSKDAAFYAEFQCQQSQLSGAAETR